MDQEQKQPEAEGKQDLIADYVNEMRQVTPEYAKRSIQKVRNTLFFIGGILFFTEIASLHQAEWPMNLYIVLFALLYGGLFVALGLWSRKKPYSALLGGIFAFIAYVLLNVILSYFAAGAAAAVKALFSNIVFKIIVLAVFNRALKGAQAVQDAQKEIF